MLQPLGGPTASGNERRPKVQFSFCIDNYKYLGNPVYIQVILDRNHITVESNHIWLTYFNDFPYLVQSPRPEYFRVKAVAQSDESLRVEVKSFGCRWLFEQDLELFDLSLLGSTMSRKRKFLEIEDSAC